MVEKESPGQISSDQHAVVQLDNIVKVYRLGTQQVRALNGVSITIGRGEMVSIMGPSGSGKSTLMNIIGCLDRPTSGTYRFDGVDVSRLRDDQLARIRNRKLGFVFQSFNLLPKLTAVANVALPLVYGGVRNKTDKAGQALEAVGLSVRGQHRPSELSGGEQQRVAIARALVNNPSLILADEPTGNLDTQSSKAIMLLLRDLNSNGITIVMVTHEEDIAAYTHRTVYVRDGVIVGEKSR